MTDAIVARFFLAGIDCPSETFSHAVMAIDNAILVMEFDDFQFWAIYDGLALSEWQAKGYNNFPEENAYSNATVQNFVHKLLLNQRER